ncbi:MAG: PAS domain-containing sensor histidine kinase [Sulfuricurvum sp.]|uniref:PAS domain-containing sensor histidine kinase n=1 Tax=Sulfuricurvum sp. TaxID=2025608 RepID=UPI0026300EF2|nr:PAS domain-containing sensor histidine kinase [Sulfuricurvum sp.]MDD2828086.1 PAS domain-containing sensor histidine kinase [Sulfuricurvum sp.]MDD4948040.1 PAS domain-containing sensor histidine kinase [Sulfuricurvum sp.]
MESLECSCYETIVNATSDLFAITDGKRIIDPNQKMIELCNALKVDIFSPSFFLSNLFEPIEMAGYIFEGHDNLPWYETVLKGEKSIYYVGIKKEGKITTFSIALHPISDHPDSYILNMSDKSEIMECKAALENGMIKNAKNREKTQHLLRQYDKAMDAATLVFKCDMEGIITFANRALCEALLYGNGELEGKHFSIFRGASTTDKVCEELWKQIQKGKIYRSTLEITDKFEGHHYFDISFVPIHDEEDHIVEFFSLSHEITDVFEAKETAVKMLESKNKFFNQVSHELRTPLNAIINFTDSALESFDEIALDEESRDLVQMYIERAHNNSQHLLKLINSLLDMAKLRAGKESYDMEECNITRLVEDIYALTETLNTKPTVAYNLESSNEPIIVYCDFLKTRQILINLISNALKFTYHGNVTLHLESDQNQCRISIIDTGVGIHASKIEKIFEPFEQVGFHDQGTGLGLGIVNEYAKRMNMHLEVHSVLGEGSRFVLNIPLVGEV